MLSSEQARDLFSEAFEGDLDEARRKAFDDALAADAELKAEFDDFVDTFQIVGRLAETEDVKPPDLLHGVQERLRKRSRGRYYRDRFSKRAGPTWMLPLISSIALLVLIALAWYVMESTVVLEAPPTPEAPDTPEAVVDDAE